MSKEIKAQYIKGKTVYAVVVNAENQYWNSLAFESFDPNHWTGYAVVMVENPQTGLYVGSFPPSITKPDKYAIFVYNRVGLVPSIKTDMPPVAAGELVWSGAAEVFPIADTSGKVSVTIAGGSLRVKLPSAVSLNFTE